MKKKLWIPFIILFTHLGLEAAELRLICSYPRGESQEYYFKPIINLEVQGNLIYGVENFAHKVQVFMFDGSGIKYVRSIGKAGQGPGDLQRPMSVSLDGTGLAVKDDNFFSIYSNQGAFLNKFKAFTKNDQFVFSGQTIAGFGSNWKDADVFEKVSRTGEKLSTFGNKKKILNYLVSTEKLFREDNSVFDGNLFTYKKSYLYISRRFGKYLLFSGDGNQIDQGDLSARFGERGEKLKNFNEGIFVSGTIKYNQPPPYSTAGIFEHACLNQGRIYFFSSEYVKNQEKKGRDTVFNLKVIDLERQVVLRDDLIHQKNIWRINGFAVLEKDGQEYIVLSLTDFNEGEFIQIFK